MCLVGGLVIIPLAAKLATEMTKSKSAKSKFSKEKGISGASKRWPRQENRCKKEVLI